jgi:hypothetical protein
LTWPSTSSAFTDWPGSHVASCAMPGLPGAHVTWCPFVTSAHTSACSRPPPPTTWIFIWLLRTSSAGSDACP